MCSYNNFLLLRKCFTKLVRQDIVSHQNYNLEKYMYDIDPLQQSCSYCNSIL